MTGWLMLICINLLAVLLALHQLYTVYARASGQRNRTAGQRAECGRPRRTWPAGPGVLERERQPQAMARPNTANKASACVVMQIKWVWLIVVRSPSQPDGRPPT